MVEKVTEDLVSLHGDKFNTDYKKNKEIIGKYAEVQSKKIRNAIAGYVTKTIKAQKQ